MSDHPNSLLAYDRSEENGANRRKRYYHFLLSRGEEGATDDEVMVGTGIPHQSIGACRHQLFKLGALVDTGRNRPTRTERQARVWLGVPGIDVTPAPPRTRREELLRLARKVIKTFTDEQLELFVSEDFSEPYDND
jgi:hypothetical protein